jgi:Ca2+-binding EF-hand superfamily protein
MSISREDSDELFQSLDRDNNGLLDFLEVKVRYAHHHF